MCLLSSRVIDYMLLSTVYDARFARVVRVSSVTQTLRSPCGARYASILKSYSGWLRRRPECEFLSKWTSRLLLQDRERKSLPTDSTGGAIMPLSDPILCWINTSKDPNKSSVWLSPVEANAVVTKSVFVNMPTRSGQKRLADRIRDTYETNSYQMLLDLASVVPSKTGSLSISLTFESLKKGIIVIEKAEQTVDPNEDDFFASMPTPRERVTEEDDDTLGF